jgi:hypothetical protein
MRKLLLLALVAVIGAAVWTLPASAAPKALSEGEMDRVTAAGEPEVLISGNIGLDGLTIGGNAGDVTLKGTTEAILTILGQTNLRALTLNNVAGENQVANAVNITAGTAIGGSQSNVIDQSWGSTVDIASQPSTKGGDVTVEKCIIGPCVTNSGNGAPGAVQSIYGDEILIGVNITKNPTKQFDLTLDATAQVDLAALTVNNVAGINQVANTLNIASSNIFVAGGAASILTISSAGGVALPDQSNTITQFRGTPCGARQVCQ